tara:strand:- start:8038 stop:9120 length:1083 start_codon:yes stop_codon:yes gene_type:complete
MINEKLKVSDGIGAWIKDFMKSDAPQFQGKSMDQRRKMAIAAFADAGGNLKEDKMNLKDFREKLSKMSGSKLTGQEISVYMRKNPGAKKDKTVRKAVEFALDHGGAMTFAVKGIEKMKKGLSNHPEVKKALQYANESTILNMKEDLQPEIVEDVTKAPKHESMLGEKTITFGYTFFAKKEMDDFFKLVKSLKGLEILSKDKQTAGHFLVRVKGDRKVVAKANSLAMKAMRTENYRTLAVKGMGAEPFDRVKVGREIDYYEPKNGDKRQGKVIKKDLKRSGTYSVKDMDNGKVHVFKYHDRNAAKKLLRSYKHYEAVEESDASWAKSLETIKRKRQLDKISAKDKKTLQDIMALLDKEKKR